MVRMDSNLDPLLTMFSGQYRSADTGQGWTVGSGDELPWYGPSVTTDRCPSTDSLINLRVTLNAREVKQR